MSGKDYGTLVYTGLSYHIKAVFPIDIRRKIPEHVKETMAHVDKSKVLKPGTTGQIPQLLD